MEIIEGCYVNFKSKDTNRVEIYKFNENYNLFKTATYSERENDKVLKNVTININSSNGVMTLKGTPIKYFDMHEFRNNWMSANINKMIKFGTSHIKQTCLFGNVTWYSYNDNELNIIRKHLYDVEKYIVEEEDYNTNRKWYNFKKQKYKTIKYNVYFPVIEEKYREINLKEETYIISQPFIIY